MSSIDHLTDQDWKNYHRTRAFTVRSADRFKRDESPHPDGPTRLAETAATLAAHLKAIEGSGSAGALGATWSLSDLVGTADRTLNLTELDAISWVEAPHLHQLSRFKPGEAVFVGGGTSWAALVDFIENTPTNPRSILTCGSYLNQSIAGSVATSTGGSRLGEGAVQNQVVGLHLVTGPDTSIWIERRSDPVLGHVAVDIADRVIRDDAIFEDALVHLGGMGLVNALVIETEPRDLFTITKVTKAVDQTWLEWVRDGDFKAIGAWLGRAETPVYYEVQIDPFALMTTPALHTMYFPARDVTPDPVTTAPPLAAEAAIPVTPASPSRVYDAVATHSMMTVSAEGPAEAMMAPQDCPIPSRCANYNCCDQTNALTDLFRYYSCCFFQDVDCTVPQSWGQIHSAPPAASREGSIYTAAFAVPRVLIDQALPAICAAAVGRPQQFLYTLRFVSHAAGTMAFQCFPESVVIDFEGIKPTPEIEAIAAQSLALAHAALEAADISYRAHWGKLGTPDADKIEADFGPSCDACSPLAQWRATRADLLSPCSLAALQNDALAQWQLT